MKKNRFWSILLLTLFLSMTGTKAFAHDIAVANDDGVTIYYVWTDDNKTELAVSYRGSSYNSYSNEYTGNVIIPESVIFQGTTYPVTSIGSHAFQDCSGLMNITIPNSVTYINGYAFADCLGLTNITIGNSVTTIGQAAFAGCSNLASLTIPNAVSIIGGSAFYGCSGLTSVTIPNSVTTIGREAFSGCI